jgi:hypothetical protein
MRSFVNAISKGEIDQFLLGVGEYVYEGRLDENEPYDFSSLWTFQIVPAYLDDVDKKRQIPILLENSLLDLLNYVPDINRGIYISVSIYLWYFYYKSKGFIPFDIETKEYQIRLRQVLLSSHESLRKDDRWTRPGYSDGIWRSIESRLMTICKKYNVFCIDMTF